MTTFFTCLLLVFYVITYFLRVISTWWIGVWSQGGFDLAPSTYPKIYFGIVVASVAFFFARDWIYSYATMKISINLFRDTFSAVMHKDTMFFTRTPTGNIISRLVNEFDFMDFDFNLQQSECYKMVFLFLSTFFLVMYTSLAFAVPVVLFFYVSWHYLKKFMKVQGEIKRMVKIVDSPLISNVTEVCKCKDLIIVMNKQDYFWKKFSANLDLFTVVRGHEMFGQSWFSQRMKHLNFFVISIMILLIIFNAKFRWIEIPSLNMVALILSSLTELTG